MSLKKKDLEIIYNLRWKNGAPANGVQSVIGVYDIPATTLNWEVFKSYLLKNSGTTGDDVRVSYVMENGKEYPIHSQIDFQVALYSFRRRARAGETINLRLERISDQPTHKNLRHSNDVETQFDNNDQSSFISTCCAGEEPPEWFLKNLAQLKKEIIEDVTATVSSVVSTALSSIKPQIVNPPNCYHHSRKSKTEKRLRKLNPHLVDSNTDAKDLIKSLKLDNKLEKLERKATKYKEKRFALFSAAKSSDSEAGHSSSRSRSHEDARMGAEPINVQETVPHMLGGEVYLHQWQVVNTGEVAWSSKTYLQYTWGSRALEPLSKIITVPCLKPGEQGTISLRLRVPNQPGSYECYWQFMHKGRRFGHWLGCQVVVDPFDLKGNRSVLETSSGPTAPEQEEPAPNTEDFFVNYGESTCNVPLPLRYSDIVKPKKNQIKFEDEDLDEGEPSFVDIMTVSDTAKKVEELTIRQDPTDTNCSSDSDNQSLLSLDGSSCSVQRLRDEFVMVPDCFKIDSPEMVQARDVVKDAKPEKDGNFDDNNNTEGNSRCPSSGNELDSIMVIRTPRKSEDAENIVYVHSVTTLKEKDEKVERVVGFSEPKDDGSIKDKEGFVFIHIDGQKVLVPKNILSSKVINVTEQSEQIQTVQSATESNPNPNTQQPSTSAEQPEINPQPSTTTEQPEINSEPDYLSHCSAAGSCFSTVNTEAERNKRLFVFPVDCPGYEVVCTDLERNETGETAPPPPEDRFFSATLTNPFNPVPNYQQTPPEMRETVVPAPSAPVQPPVVNQPGPRASATPPEAPPVHTLPDTFVSGAVNVASTAINTARSVINMMRPQSPGSWVNGRWVSNGTQTVREANLQALAEMGFWNRDLNATLLARFNDDLNRVVAELVQ